MTGSGKRRAVAVAVALAAGLGLWLSLGPRPTSAPPARAGEATRGSPARALASAGGEAPSAADRIALADGLNAADGDPARDVEILAGVLEAWRTNFPGQGNPIGSNAEITAALTGANALGLALVPADHPAVSASGELVDRWGTPYFFHAIGGDRMEVTTLGPDRRRGTPDDVTWRVPE